MVGSGFQYTGTLSSLLGATQAVAASLSAQASAPAAPVVFAQEPAQAKVPEVVADVVVAAEDGRLQVVSTPASAPQGTAPAVVDDSDQDMASEAEARSELEPVDPRPPPPEAKKPRCGDPQELVIAT